ncbi:MAG: alpha/beta hydrolase [Clostridia bacterium]|nr:alpha/beta hydrolase [Clostridia bacterium]
MKNKVLNIIILLMLMCCMCSILSGCFIFDNGTKIKNLKYGPHERNVLDIYLPKSPDRAEASVPVFLLIHGGGWAAGDKGDYKDFAKTLNKHGYAAVSMNYRFVDANTTYLDMLDDIAAAIRYIKDNGDIYKINTDNIALMGGSAGAHLALLYSYKCYETSPINIAFVLSMVGPTDFTDSSYYADSMEYKDFWFNILSGLIGESITSTTYLDQPAALLDASPISHVIEGVPPTILAYGALDNLVPYSNAERLYAALQSHNIPSNLITYSNSGHGLESDKDKAEELTQQILQAASAYFN